MRWLRALKFWQKIGLGIILFIFILLFAAPRITRNYMVRHSMELIGRKLDIGSIRVNYITGTLRIDSLVLYEKNPPAVFLGFRRLKINFRYLPLFRNEISISEILLENPHVQIIQDGDLFNFSDLAETDTTVADTATGPPLKYLLKNIRISRGYVTYTDIPLANTIAMNNLDLNIPGFTWNSDSTDLAVDFRFVDGGGLFADLSLNQADSTYGVHLKLDSLNLGILQPYITRSLNISSIKGFMSNDLTIRGSMQHVTQVFIRGVSSVYDFQLSDLQERAILTCKSFAVDIDTFRFDKNRVHLKSIDITGPFVWIEMIDSTNNLLALVKYDSTETTESLAEKDSVSGTAGAFTFSRLTVRDGSIRFTDRTLRVPFDYTIGKVMLDGAPADAFGQLRFHMAAMLNNTSGVVSDALFNPGDLTTVDFGMSVKQFRMKDVDAYFRHYFGFPVSGGMLNFSTENQIRPLLLSSDSKVYWRKFTLGERTGDSSVYHVPLRLAIAVLSDKDGIINLGAPVEMKGEQVKVRQLGRIVFKIIGSFFLKAATSPYTMLADLYKMNPDRLREIKLLLFEDTPDKENMETLDVIADILNKKPALKAGFYYYRDEAGAMDSLAWTMARKDFYAYLEKEPGSADSDTAFRAFILHNTPATDTAAWDMPGMCRRYVGEENLINRLDSLRKGQIGFLNDYLTREKVLAPARFSIVSDPVDTIRSKSSLASFMIYFTAADEADSSVYNQGTVAE